MSTDRCLKALVRDPLGPLTLMVLAWTRDPRPLSLLSERGRSSNLDTCGPLPLSPLVLLEVSEMKKLCFMCVVVFLIRAWDITITASC